MLVAKINPPAKKIVQATPFTSTELTADQMIVKCTQLVIGGAAGSNSDSIKFEVRFGKVEYEKNPDGSNGNAIFNILLMHQPTLTQQELATWGTDDTVIFTLIAQKLGINIISLDDYPTLNFTN
jgi:hypothetical protein